MVVGVIKRDVVTTLSDVIGLLLLQSESWNLKELYPKFYTQGKNLAVHLKSCLSFAKKTFEDANDWIGAYCNAFDEFDLAQEDLPLYKLLMDYTTRIPWILAYDNDDIDTYVISKD